MEKIDRRKYPRVQICDPISYLCIDAKGTVFDQNIGVARDVSQNGIQIETFHEIKSEYALLMFFDLAKNPLEVRGKVIYCKKNESGQFNIGFKLQGTAKENILFVTALVRSYHYQKEKSRLVITPSI
jgi:hypothetical protein